MLTEASLQCIYFFFLLALPLVVKPEHFWGAAAVPTPQMALYHHPEAFPQCSGRAEVMDTAPGPSLLFPTLQVWGRLKEHLKC